MLKSIFNYLKLKIEFMNILVTAIGSMSADCVIHSLKEHDCFVVGCDIYPAEWHASSKDCDLVVQSPMAHDEILYVDFMINLSVNNNIDYIFPLIDVEVDVLNKYRSEFEEKGIEICLPPPEAIEIARNKYALYKRFKDDKTIPSITTFSSKTDPILSPKFPYIAKPCDGRSSEGLVFINDINELNAVFIQENYIIQEYIEGRIFTVDYIRNNMTGHDFSITREELLRTKNGAGTTVHMLNDETLKKMSSHIGNTLNINGCINLEFIKSDERYYLIDINPRFSAGIAFTKLSGYDIVGSHLNCFTGKDIYNPVPIQENIITKRYIDIIL